LRANGVSYTDAFVILCRGRAAEALTWTTGVMTKLGLTINETKTVLRSSCHVSCPSGTLPAAAERRSHPRGYVEHAYETLPKAPLQLRTRHEF
jgi:hypothetical protein